MRRPRTLPDRVPRVLPRSRRVLPALIAAGYLLAQSDGLALASVGARWFAGGLSGSSPATVAAEPNPCAAHRCGCPASDVRLESCCCFPRSPKASSRTSERRARLSARRTEPLPSAPALRCAGGSRDSSTQPAGKPKPHLPIEVASLDAPERRDFPAPAVASPRAPGALDPPLKVPKASS